MTTRCKFKCDTITQHQNKQRSVVFVPVYSDVEGSENKKFWQYTLSGKFEMGYINENVNFEVGKEYYIDITESPDQV